MRSTLLRLFLLPVFLVSNVGFSFAQNHPSEYQVLNQAALAAPVTDAPALEQRISEVIGRIEELKKERRPVRTRRKYLWDDKGREAENERLLATIEGQIETAGKELSNLTADHLRSKIERVTRVFEKEKLSIQNFRTLYSLSENVLQLEEKVAQLEGQVQSTTGTRLVKLERSIEINKIQLNKMSSALAAEGILLLWKSDEDEMKEKVTEHSQKIERSSEAVKSLNEQIEKDKASQRWRELGQQLQTEEENLNLETSKLEELVFTYVTHRMKPINQVLREEELMLYSFLDIRRLLNKTEEHEEKIKSLKAKIEETDENGAAVREALNQELRKNEKQAARFWQEFVDLAVRIFKSDPSISLKTALPEALFILSA